MPMKRLKYITCRMQCDQKSLNAMEREEPRPTVVELESPSDDSSDDGTDADAVSVHSGQGADSGDDGASDISSTDLNDYEDAASTSSSEPDDQFAM